MTTGGEDRDSGNFILDSLPIKEYQIFQPHLKQVYLTQKDVLAGVREPIAQVYFPTTAIVSLLNSTLEGDTIELGVTGFEGVVGTTLLLNEAVIPWEAQVQLAGEAWQLETQVFVDALHKLPSLRQKVSAFTDQKIMQLTQSALCNRFHTVEQRLCRWLLASQDRARTAELPLT